MSKIEKLMSVLAVLCVISAITLSIVVTNQIKAEGGIKAIAIEAGKDFKDVYKEIKEH